MTENPYTPPDAAVPTSPSVDIVKLYSPSQVFCGTLLGGPVGLIYFLRENFSALGDDSAMAKTVLYGGLLILGLLVIPLLLPKNFPSIMFVIAYIVTAESISEKYQKTKQEIIDSPQHDFHSNWRVIGFGLLCLAGSAIVLWGPILSLAALIGPAFK